MLHLIFLLLLGTNDPKIETIETIVAELPQYCLDRSINNEWIFINLEPRPTNINRQYFVHVVDNFGNSTGKIFQLDEESFYVLAKKMVRFGVTDRSELDVPCLNDKYEKFIRLLVRHKIITTAELKVVARYYCEMHWIESAYHLDNGVPKIISFEDWKSLAQEFENYMPMNRYYYFTTLANIKSAGSVQDLNNAMDWLNQKLVVDEPSPYSYIFLNYSKAYAELEKFGIHMNETIQISLLENYLIYGCKNSTDILLRLNELKKKYSAIGLPQPEKKEINNALNKCLEALLDKNGNLNPMLVKTVRESELKFTEELAIYYRNVLLSEAGSFFEDIDYLTKIIGKEVHPKLWISCAYLNLREYKDREYRREKQDSTDYFHIAVENFRRAGKNEINNKTDALLNSINDLSVRISDIITVYELLGKNPKLDFYVTKFDERAKLYEELACGIYCNNSQFIWHQNEYGQKIIPFRDAIELAAYLNNNERTRALSLKIFHRANWQLSQTNKSTSCEELEEILNLYESLKFTGGAYSLGLHLHEAGFIEQARRAFQIAGVEKKVEKLFPFSKPE